MTVRVYRSTDASAPTLTGQVGSLTTLLDAVLVNGYGSQTAAGWSINQTTTNKRGYKQNTTGANNSSGMLLYVDDTGPGAGGAREARVCGFESMSAITPTGTGQFPTGSQSSVGTGQLVIRKSATADSTARAWTIVANGQTIYLFTETGDTTIPTAACTFVFGDFKSFKSSDQYAVSIIARVAENSGASFTDSLHIVGASNNNTYNLSNVIMGHFVARHWTGTGGAIKVGKTIDSSKLYYQSVNGILGGYSSDTQTSASSAGMALGRWNQTTAWPFPNGPDGAIWLSPIYLNHHMALRGYLPGLWAPLHDRPLGHNDTLTYSGGNLNGKSMVAQNIHAYINGSNNGDAGQVLVETSDTWS